MAPQLELFCLLSFDRRMRPVREKVIGIVDHARASFPALRRLRFHMKGGSAVTPPAVPFDFSLTSPDIRTWIEAGLEVDVLWPLD
jgi:hypothetical protein